jgi:hypothetical protein
MKAKARIALVWLTVLFVAWCAFTSMNRPDTAPQHIDHVNLNDYQLPTLEN